MLVSIALNFPVILDGQFSSYLIIDMTDTSAVNHKEYISIVQTLSRTHFVLLILYLRSVRLNGKKMCYHADLVHAQSYEQILFQVRITSLTISYRSHRER
jgi:hypothetical protein